MEFTPTNTIAGLANAGKAYSYQKVPFYPFHLIEPWVPGETANIEEAIRELDLFDQDFLFRDAEGFLHYGRLAKGDKYATTLPLYVETLHAVLDIVRRM